MENPLVNVPQVQRRKINQLTKNSGSTGTSHSFR